MRLEEGMHPAAAQKHACGRGKERHFRSVHLFAQSTAGANHPYKKGFTEAVSAGIHQPDPVQAG